MAPIDPNDTLFEAVFEASLDGILVFRDQTIVLANTAAARMYGYSPAELEGQPWTLVSPRRDQPRINAIIEEHYRGAPLPSVVTSIGVRKDGTEFENEARTCTYEFGGQVYTLAIIRDVTLQLKAERSLRESQNFYRDLFDKNPAIKLLIDPVTGQIVNANESAQRFYGYAQEEMRAMRIWDINVLPEDEVRSALDKCRQRDKRVFFMRHRLKSGEVRDMEIHSGPVEIGDRPLLLSILMDVTERRKLQEQLWQAQKMEVMGQMAGGVAHDFNNFLTAMMTSLDLILDDPQAQDNVRKLAEQMLRGTNIAQGLTARLLAFSRKQVLQPRKLDLNEAVRDVANLLDRVTGPKIQVLFHQDPNSCWIRADDGSIRQVLMNLVVNARDAMPDGGSVEISTRCVGDWVELRVKDSGVGMNEDVRSHLFEPFFTTKGKEKGTGLGLATVYGIVRQNEGDIAVESSPGKGSLFIIRLPRVRPEPVKFSAPDVAPETAAAESSAEPTRRVRVLVVEDDRDIRELLVEAFRREGIEVVDASGAQQGLEAFRALPRNSVDLVITDVMMMGMSGIELAAELLELQPSLKVLFISGFADGRITDRTTSQPGIGFLAKPFTAKTLIEHSRRLLNS